MMSEDTKIKVDARLKKILGQVGELLRIKGADPANQAAAGVSVITDHIHFLQDGEPVRVIKRVELRP